MTSVFTLAFSSVHANSTEFTLCAAGLCIAACLHGRGSVVGHGLCIGSLGAGSLGLHFCCVSWSGCCY